MDERTVELIKKEEQLRILKNYIKSDGVTKYDLERLVDAINETNETEKLEKKEEK